MTDSTMQRELEVFRTYVRRRGMRMTPERMALFEEIFSRHEHVDADRLHAEMERNGRKISRASVYRNLDLLAESGLVRKHRLDRNRFLYEHIHVGFTHDHLVCQECGRVVEFVSPGIRELQRELARAHDFDPSAASVHIVGRCLVCKQAREAVVEEGR
jgi:Fur family ferric uptake transcriptional regulator